MVSPSCVYKYIDVTRILSLNKAKLLDPKNPYLPKLRVVSGSGAGSQNGGGGGGESGSNAATAATAATLARILQTIENGRSSSSSNSSSSNSNSNSNNNSDVVISVANCKKRMKTCSELFEDHAKCWTSAERKTTHKKMRRQSRSLASAPQIDLILETGSDGGDMLDDIVSIDNSQPLV